MKIVLIQNVENLGRVGDEKEVKDGFARNYLLPRKLAVSPSDPMAKTVIEQAKKEKEKLAKEQETLISRANELSGKTVEIVAKAGEKGRLFAAVTSVDVAKKLKIDSKDIEMQPIKDVGEHDVIIKLGHGMETKIKVKITAKAEKSKKK